MGFWKKKRTILGCFFTVGFFSPSALPNFFLKKKKAESQRSNLIFHFMQHSAFPSASWSNFWFPPPFQLDNNPHFHKGSLYAHSHMLETLKKQRKRLMFSQASKPLCHFQWYVSRTGETHRHYGFGEVPPAPFAWCKFTREQIYCNLSVKKAATVWQEEWRGRSAK